MASNCGGWATQISLAAFLATAVVQLVVVGLTGIVALLADTIHNFGGNHLDTIEGNVNVAQEVGPNKRFNYGYGQAEDSAGLFIAVSILGTGIYAGYESIARLSDLPKMDYIWVVAAAAIIGFIFNKPVALFRMKIGKEVGSAALVPTVTTPGSMD